MFRLFSVFLCFGVFFSVSSSEAVFAAEIMAKSELQAATVYTNRATLTRQAIIDVPAGAHKLVFSGLPNDLLPDSLRAEGSAKASVIFGALSHKQVFAAKLVIPREQELHDKIEALQDQRKVVSAEKAALGAKQAFLTNLGKLAGLRANEDIAEIDLKPEQWGAAADTIQGNTAAILKANLAHDISLRKIDREIRKLQKDIQDITAPDPRAYGRRSTYQVSIPLEVEVATKLTIELSYQVPGVSWRPLYDARLDTETGDLEITQFGVVQQRTGEDWKDIALVLSTAQPHRGAGLPDLSPMWVNLFQREPMASKRAMFSAGAVMEDSAVMALAEAPMERRREMKAQFVQAEIDTGGFTSEYRIPGPSTVVSDGTESKLLIGSFETENKLQIQIKPQLSTNAFLVASAKLKGEAPILPGRVSLFRDGAYVGQSVFPLLRPEEEHSLGFGIDDQIAVTRRVMKDEHSEAGLISKDSIKERHFLTELQNLHTIPVELIVFETLPVSKDKKIEVEIKNKATSPGFEEDADNVKGLLRWSLKLEPQQKTDIKLGWKVSWPEGSSISGL